MIVELFFIFFKIGLFTIGGGYAMIPLMKTEVISRGWVTSDAVMNFLAVSESTPGPFAINMATFIGFSQAGVLGAIVATTGVVLPSIIIISLIALLFENLMKNKYVHAIFDGFKSIAIGLIIGVGFSMLIENLFPSNVAFDWRAGIIAGLTFGLTKIPKIKSIAIIFIAAFCGLLLYGALNFL